MILKTCKEIQLPDGELTALLGLVKVQDDKEGRMGHELGVGEEAMAPLGKSSCMLFLKDVYVLRKNI
jgi:hypothetical protein